MVQNQQNLIPVQDIAQILEPIIRRVVREELIRIIDKNPGMFFLRPEMPIYQDMLDLKHKKSQDKIELHSHEEVWGE